MKYKEEIMLLQNKFKYVTLYLLLSCVNICPAETRLHDFMPASTYYPEGSGARARGMAGAFMVIADDSTAGYWNPACLHNLHNKEFAIVTDYFHRIEDNKFLEQPESDGIQSVSHFCLNHVSIAWPFYGKLFYGLPDAHHVISFNYQKQYDFTQKWNMQRQIQTATDHIDYQSEGKLSTIGIAYSLLIRENLFLGLMFNIWNNDLTQNHWKQTTYQECIQGNKQLEKALSTHTHIFNGYNANIGMLMTNIFNTAGLYKVNLGLVLKTPLTAEISELETFIHSKTGRQQTQIETSITMPVTYGIGAALVSNDFNCELDIYHTRWNDSFFKAKPATTARIGAEYLFKQNTYLIPFRCGLAYESSPAENTTDLFWKLSLGTGIEFIDYYAIDFAYQFRFADNVGESILAPMKFSQNIREHEMYSSIIFYF
jgi:hypothetical protein